MVVHALVQLITYETTVTTSSCVWPVFPCVRRLPQPPGWRWLAGAGASRGGWRPLASSAAPWVFSYRSGSRSLIGWQLGHCLGCRSSQTLGERPRVMWLDEEARVIWSSRRMDSEDEFDEAVCYIFMMVLSFKWNDILSSSHKTKHS